MGSVDCRKTVDPKLINQHSQGQGELLFDQLQQEEIC